MQQILNCGKRLSSWRPSTGFKTSSRIMVSCFVLRYLLRLARFHVAPGNADKGEHAIIGLTMRERADGILLFPMSMAVCAWVERKDYMWMLLD